MSKPVCVLPRTSASNGAIRMIRAVKRGGDFGLCWKGNETATEEIETSQPKEAFYLYAKGDVTAPRLTITATDFFTKPLHAGAIADGIPVLPMRLRLFDRQFHLQCFEVILDILHRFSASTQGKGREAPIASSFRNALADLTEGLPRIICLNRTPSAEEITTAIHFQQFGDALHLPNIVFDVTGGR